MVAIALGIATHSYSVLILVQHFPVPWIFSRSYCGPITYA